MDAPLSPHRSVLTREVLRFLRVGPEAIIVDATLGGGGHAAAVLDALGPQGRLYGIDRDPAALSLAARRLARHADRLVALRGNHLDLCALLAGAGVSAVDGIVADLGVSSIQLDDPARGFSFQVDGPLDMRMDPDTGRTAAELLATLSEIELRRLLWKYGGEKRAAAIARAVVRQRARGPLRRTRELADLVQRVTGPRGRAHRIHPATRTFQALRIAVNGEVEGLEQFVADAVSLLRPGGRLVIVAFHSLEDRAVKTALRALARRCTCPPELPVCGCGRRNLVRILTSRPVRPGAEELRDNPRARSARLRAAERL